MLGVAPPNASINATLENYFQSFPIRGGKSQNVLAFIEGIDSKLKSEVIVLSAHYDHLGTGAVVKGDSIFNGAADDGSGTVALLELAKSFKDAKAKGHGSKRSILFLHAGGEESGLLGSSHYVSEPAVPLNRIVANINLDGVGGSDKPNAANGFNYVYLLKNDSTSESLAEIVLNINKEIGTNLEILKPENPSLFNSDNKPFEYELIPSLYFSNGLTEHYHKVTDNPETINYDHMATIVRLVFATTWSLANDKLPESYANRNKFAKNGEWFCPPCDRSCDLLHYEKSGACPTCRMILRPVWVNK